MTYTTGLSLIEIITGNEASPKAIIMAGAPGAGKGTIVRELNLEDVVKLNIDDIYIKKLKEKNVSLDLKRADAEARSLSSKAMNSAQGVFKDVRKDVQDKRESFLIDGTAENFKKISREKVELEEIGYDVMMVYVYSDLQRSLKQNNNRFEKSGGKDRSLSPSLVLSNWVGVTKNYFPYRELFGDKKFISVANTLKDEKIETVEKILEKYVNDYIPTDTKPKTPAEQKRSDDKKKENYRYIQEFLDKNKVQEIIDNSVSKEEAIEAIETFLR